MKLRILFFLILSLCLFGGSSFYVGLHLTANLLPSHPFSILIWAALGIGFLMLWLAPILTHARRKHDESASLSFKVLQFLAYFFLSHLVLLLLFFLFFDLLGFVFPTSVEIFQAHLPLGVFLLSLSLNYLGFHTAKSGPKVFDTKIFQENLHPDLEGFRIVQISDLHVGSQIQKPYVQRVVDLCNRLDADVVILTGDIVDGSIVQHRKDLEPFKEIQAKHGKFYVTGNHEYFWDADEIIKAITSHNITHLHNEHRVLKIKGATLCIVGVPDVYAGLRGSPSEGPNPAKAFEGMPNSNFTIYLTHQPNTVKMVENFPLDLQLSGHTHGGQFFPVHWLVKLFNLYNQGLHRHKEKFWVYVNRGTGFWGPPNRLGVHAEISLIVLSTVRR